MTSATPIRSSRPIWPVVAMLALAALINYVDRSNMSVAAPFLKSELNLDERRLGLLFAAFFTTYSLMQPLVGWLVDRIGSGRVFAAGFLLWSLATSATGLARGFGMLFAARLALGLGESVFFPCCARILARMMPPRRIGSANATIMAGMHLGPAFGIFVGGMLMARFGWRPFFIVVGLASLIWLLPWMYTMPRDEAPLTRATPDGPSLGRMLRVRSLWGTCFGLFAGNYAWYFLLTWLPYYLVHERGLSAAQMARLGGMAYVCSASTSFVTGWLTDRWIAAGASHTLVRKSTLVAGYLLAGLMLVLCARASASHFAPFVVISTMCIGGCGFSTFAVGQTIAGPKAAGKWVGIQNAFGNLSGVVAPALTGFVAQRTGHFLPAFLVTCGVCVFGAATWMFVVGRVEPMEWNTASAFKP
jgi:MFS family permease